MAVTSEDTLNALAERTAGREVARRRTMHLRRIRSTTNARAGKWQSQAWLAAELKQFDDGEAARIARGVADLIGRGWIPVGDPMEEAT